MNTVIAWQKDHVGELGGQVAIGDKTVELPACPVTLPQLQRIRRQFISMNRQHNLAKPRIHGSFIEYLNTSFG